jgi:hypothetical protein
VTGPVVFSYSFVVQHAPAWHSPDAQSAVAEHPRPSTHGAHDPPQSTSVSLPFFTPSEHVGAGVFPATNVDGSPGLAPGGPAPPPLASSNDDRLEHATTKTKDMTMP